MEVLLAMRLSTVVLLSVTTIAAPIVSAQTCSGVADFIGGYGFVASRSFFVPVGVTPPGTPGGSIFVPIAVTAPGTSTGLSLTPIGKLITSAFGPSPFASTGRVQSDGSGNLFAFSGVSSLPASARIGTYTVNTDCTVAMTIFDFPSATTGVAPTGTGTQITLEGAISDSGDVVELIQTGTAAVGASMRLQRTAQNNACNNASLNGRLNVTGGGLLLSGSGITATVVPLAFTGVLFADGAGNFTTPPGQANSALKARHITGTYTVNADCTGTGTLMNGGVSRAINFVLVNSDRGTDCPPPRVNFTDKRALWFTFTDAATPGFGVAQ